MFNDYINGQAKQKKKTIKPLLDGKTTYLDQMSSNSGRQTSRNSMMTPRSQKSNNSTTQ